jgi:hypothetical protein
MPGKRRTRNLQTTQRWHNARSLLPIFIRNRLLILFFGSCEEMGTGKTCVSLALICMTKGQLARVEPLPGDQPARVLTPFARQFPFESCRPLKIVPPDIFDPYSALVVPDEDAEQPEGSPEEPQETEFPSLVKLCCHVIRASRLDGKVLEAARESLQSTGLSQELQSNRPFYEIYPPVPERTTRRFLTEPQAILISQATLCIVPDSYALFFCLTVFCLVFLNRVFSSFRLVDQWLQEIKKHVQPDYLRVVVVGNRDAVPDPEVLVDSADLVLMSLSRFGREADTAPMFDVQSKAPLNRLCRSRQG